jgi:hypothetical protein
MTTLTYDGINEALQAAIPEVRGHDASLLKAYADSGPYIVFAFSLKPVLKSALKSNDSQLLARIFRFFEQMAISPDIQVTNLLQIEVFEWLVGESRDLSTAWKYMGEETKNIARRTARIRRCEHNLPKEKKRKD